MDNFKPDYLTSQEKSAKQLYEELDQTTDEVMKLMEQVHELEMKAGADGLSKEDFDSIVDERNKLAAQLDEKWESEKRLEEEWKKAADREWKELEEEHKRSEE